MFKNRGFTNLNYVDYLNAKFNQRKIHISHVENTMKNYFIYTHHPTTCQQPTYKPHSTKH